MLGACVENALQLELRELAALHQAAGDGLHQWIFGSWKLNRR